MSGRAERRWDRGVDLTLEVEVVPEPVQWI